MQIKNIKLENFMGVTEEEFNFSPKKNIVSGANGTGKTTLFDAHLWLWTDYNSGLKNNPSIRPLDGRECIVKVTETILLDSGAVCTVAKIQKEKRSKPDENGRTRVTGIINSYEINSVGKTERDFKAEMAERGINVDENFLVLSHPEVFLSKKAMDMRKVLFGMAKSHTDKEIADMVPGCEMVSKLLDTYRLDEITAMQKATKKDAERKLKDLPQQIIGLNKARVEVDVPSLEKAKAEKEAAISELSKPVEKPSEEEMEELRKSIYENGQKAYEISVNASKSLLEAKKAKSDEMNKLTNEVSALGTNAYTESMTLDRLKQEGRTAVAEKNELLSAIQFLREKPRVSFGVKEIEAEKFDERNCSCPTCGRAYTPKEQDKIRSRWQKEHQSRLDNAKRMEADNEAIIKADIDAKQKKVDALTAKIAELTTKVNKQKRVYGKASSEYETAQKKLEAMSAEYARMPETIDVSTSLENIAIQKTISEQKQKLAEMEAKKQEAYSEEAFRRNKISILQNEIEELNNKLASVDFNRNIDIKISELEDAQRKEGQNQANAEKILAQCDAVSRKRNELLTEEINEYFSIVSFKLFDYQKNGEYKETCIPEVRDGSDWKVIGLEANTALSTLGKLDIIDGLQKFYAQNLPVFVDFAAELDEKSMGKIQTEMQLIFLVVNNADLEVKGVA